MSVSIPSFKLITGAAIPALAYGSGTAWYKSDASGSLDRTLVEAIKTAIGLGYRHIDGAEMYGNEAEVGVAIAESGVPRSELFITTKLWPSVHDPIGTFNSSLKKLGTDYVDLYLLHCPFFSEATHGTTPARVWEDLETLHAQGKARAIGVSNFRVPDFETLLQTAKVVPAVNQVELNPYCYDHELVRFAKEKGILMSAYCPLAPIVKFSGGPVDEVVERIARKHGKSREVVIIKWGVQNGWMVVTTSSKVERLRDVGQIEGWDLTVEEVEEITRAGAQWKRRAFWNTEYA